MNRTARIRTAAAIASALLIGALGAAPALAAPNPPEECETLEPVHWETSNKLLTRTEAPLETLSYSASHEGDLDAYPFAFGGDHPTETLVAYDVSIGAGMTMRNVQAEVTFENAVIVAVRAAETPAPRLGAQYQADTIPALPDLDSYGERTVRVDIGDMPAGSSVVFEVEVETVGGSGSHNPLLTDLTVTGDAVIPTACPTPQPTAEATRPAASDRATPPAPTAVEAEGEEPFPTTTVVVASVAGAAILAGAGALAVTAVRRRRLRMRRFDGQYDDGLI